MPLPVIECKTQVAAVRRLTAEILEVDLAMREPAEFTFEAGEGGSGALGPRPGGSPSGGGGGVRAPPAPKPAGPYTPPPTRGTRSQITLCADVTPGVEVV